MIGKLSAGAFFCVWGVRLYIENQPGIMPWLVFGEIYVCKYAGNR